jgi:hypothetical protein
MTRKMYMCGVDWQHELCEAPDLEGRAPLYSSVEELKRLRTCWEECGIVEVEIQVTKWVQKQDLFRPEKMVKFAKVSTQEDVEEVDIVRTIP